jgi:hypothetical protein
MSLHRFVIMAVFTAEIIFAIQVESAIYSLAAIVGATLSGAFLIDPTVSQAKLHNCKKDNNGK